MILPTRCPISGAGSSSYGGSGLFPQYLITSGKLGKPVWHDARSNNIRAITFQIDSGLFSYGLGGKSKFPGHVDARK